MGINDIRKRIDEVDDQLVRLFCERMYLVALVAVAKWRQGLPINDNAREQEVCERAAKMAGLEFAPYVRRFFSAVFSLSKDYQALQTTAEKWPDSSTGDG
jgi:chorismate mutase/prephenate dehydratase